MLGAVALTAALASFAASLYGQGKLSAEDAWQFVPNVLVPTSMAIGADSRLLGEEIVKLKEELKTMQSHVKNTAKRKMSRGGSLSSKIENEESDEIEDEDSDDHTVASVRSLQRQLSQSIVQLETARQQLADEQRLNRELEETKRHVASELQARARPHPPPVSHRCTCAYAHMRSANAYISYAYVARAHIHRCKGVTIHTVST
jgi:hypothetical protein